MKTKILIVEWAVIIAVCLACCASFVFKIDPYFHYHKPLLDDYFYTLNNQRSQNDGISKYFDYDALITGTSMAENFKTTEFDEIFGVNSIKVCFSGGTYKESNDNLAVALKSNPNLKTVIRSLDMSKFFSDKDSMRFDLGKYPTYLYDNNPFNDVNYLLNKDVIFTRAFSMVRANDDPDAPRGITSFDEYSRWQYNCFFGVKQLDPMSSVFGKQASMTEQERKTIEENIRQNVTSLADAYPDVDFYCFITPYSIAWWDRIINDGSFDKQIEAEKFIIELILEHPNIHLYSFNTETNITTDLNNYTDTAHYGQWINSLILHRMHDGEGLLTKDNYEQYLEEEYDFYATYDYAAANDQVDYEADFYAAALLNREINGAVPVDLLNDDSSVTILNAAEKIDDLYDGKAGVRCQGSLKREAKSDVPISDYIRDAEFIGLKVQIDEIGNHRFLAFNGKKEAAYGQPCVYVYDENGAVVASLSKNYKGLDNKWHQYVIELPNISGEVTVIANGGYIDNTGSPESAYSFGNFILY